jgi:large subunit ribosomal protein L9
MPKTEVILTSNIVGLGAESDLVKVAAGYARNYLIPQGLAIPQTGANKRRLEVLRQRRAEREAHEFNTMNELAKSISKLICVVKVKTGDDGKMFGSVTSGTIADELKHQFEISLDKRKIHIEHPIRTVGEYELDLRLHAEVHAKLKVRVESSNPPPAVEEEAKRSEEGKEGEGRRPGRFERRPRRMEERPAGDKPAAEAASGPRPGRPDRKPRPAKPEKAG